MHTARRGDTLPVKKPHGSALQTKIVRVTRVRGTLPQALSHPSHHCHLDRVYKTEPDVTDALFLLLSSNIFRSWHYHPENFVFIHIPDLL